ncbi:hypothetical protein BKA80DRAFT_305014 [Phyllosticta citrichinensis]
MLSFLCRSSLQCSDTAAASSLVTFLASADVPSVDRNAVVIDLCYPRNAGDPGYPAEERCAGRALSFLRKIFKTPFTAGLTTKLSLQMEQGSYFCFSSFGIEDAKSKDRNIRVILREKSNGETKSRRFD